MNIFSENLPSIHENIPGNTATDIYPRIEEIFVILKKKGVSRSSMELLF